MTDVDYDALRGIVSALERGKQAIDDTASDAPGAVDAGVMTAWVAERLTEISAAAAAIATGLGVSGSNVGASLASYQATDSDVADNMSLGGPR